MQIRSQSPDSTEALPIFWSNDRVWLNGQGFTPAANHDKVSYEIRIPNDRRFSRSFNLSGAGDDLSPIRVFPMGNSYFWLGDLVIISAGGYIRE